MSGKGHMQKGNMMELWRSLGLDKADFPCVIAIVGSGGKTSLMGRLAEEGKKHHLRVAVTTTTHIRKPPVYQEVFSRMEKGTITIFGENTKEEKLKYPGDSCYNEMAEQADLVLVEADGSRGFPIKYPAEYEPVIPDNTDMILCVCGMSGLGKEAVEVCHRWELAESSWLTKVYEPGLESEPETEPETEQEIKMTEELLAWLLEKGYGRPVDQKFPHAKFFYCMNQADSRTQRQAAKRILQKTGRSGLVLSMKDKKNILYLKDDSTESRQLKVEKPDARKAAFIYMASGLGKRYGANKLLEQIEGKPLYLHGLQALRTAADRLRSEAGIEIELIVVSCYEEILKNAEQLRAVPIYNPDSQQGITASIHLGIQAAGGTGAYLFAVADQPWLKAESIQRMVEGFYGSTCTIACLTDGIRKGNPVIFSEKYREELMGLTGDKGGSVILRRYPWEVYRILVEALELKDIDRPPA